MRSLAAPLHLAPERPRPTITRKVEERVKVEEKKRRKVEKEEKEERKEERFRKTQWRNGKYRQRKNPFTKCIHIDAWP